MRDRSKLNLALALFFAGITTAGLAACNNSTQLEACRLIEIEDAEAEVDLGDVDIERGEVEMVCDGDVIDVTWAQFRDRLDLDPGQYKDNIRGLEDVVQCFKDENNNKEIVCQKANGGDFVGLSFSFDD